jgi:hypothetical protein
MTDLNSPRWRLAVHEAAHGIACLATNTPLYSLEVDANNEAGRCRSAPPSDDDGSFASSESCKTWKRARRVGIRPPLGWVKRNVIVYLAGPMGTLRLVGDFRGCGGDFEDVQAFLNLWSKSTKRREAVYCECEREADRIINHLYPYLVLAVASCLYHKSPLYFAEVCDLLRHCGSRGVRLLNNLNRIKTE